MRRILLLSALVLVTMTTTTTAAFDAGCLVGLDLPAALEMLRQQGLTIISSSALVDESMKVSSPPTAQDPRTILHEILAPHGLTVLEGSRGQLVVVALPRATTRPGTGAIVGKVLIGGGEPGDRAATAHVLATDLRTRIAADGTFVFPQVPPGTYDVEVCTPGASPVTMRNVVVRKGEVSPLLVRIDQPSPFLSDIVVTPSHFRLLETEPERRTFLSSDKIARTPHVADDLFRAVKRLPGASGGDYSATFNVRGGEQQELLVILDGVKLYEPFHLKDFQSIFSIVDAEATGGVDLLTGCFPVEYGDRMSGVMDIATATPTGPPRLTLAASTLNARVASSGSFDRDRGQWLVNLRAWDPERVATRIRRTDKEVRSDYYDVLGKLQHTIGPRSVLSANLLFAYDDLGFSEHDEESMETVAARYDSHQAWLNLRTDWSEALFSQTVLSEGEVERERTGSTVDHEDGTLGIDDRRNLGFVGFSQDWTFRGDDNHLLKWGIELRREWSRYRYERRTADAADPPALAEERFRAEPRGTSYGAYLSDRFRLGPSLVVEAGLRWDRQLVTDEHQVSPRINARYALGNRTTLRAGWGRFFQSQRLNELQIEDGVSQFSRAQLAEHSLLSVEHLLPAGLALRLELYHKRLSRLRPRYENLFSPLELFPEAAPDRVEIAPDRGRVRGLELLVSDDDGDSFDWWCSYSLSRAEDHVDGRWTPRSWDQRHAATAGLNWKLGRRYNLNLAASWHTGWPTTAVRAVPVEGAPGEITYELVPGPRNAERLPAYFRLDLRASRILSSRHGELRVFLETINLTNRANMCCYDDFDVQPSDDGRGEVTYKTRYWAPIVPSLGVSWSF